MRIRLRNGIGLTFSKLLCFMHVEPLQKILILCRNMPLDVHRYV